MPRAPSLPLQKSADRPLAYRQGMGACLTPNGIACCSVLKRAFVAMLYSARRQLANRKTLRWNDCHANDLVAAVIACKRMRPGAFSVEVKPASNGHVQAARTRHRRGT